MILPTARLTNFAVSVVCLTAMLMAVLYFQNHLGLEPCYLCITQRFFVVAVGLVCLLAALFNARGIALRVFAVLTLLLAVSGGYFSAKQLWLQSLPEDQVPVCGPPVDYLFDAFSTSHVISMLIRGDGNCAEVKWQLLGLSMPGWVLILFAVFAMIGCWQFLRRD